MKKDMHAYYSLELILSAIILQKQPNVCVPFHYSSWGNTLQIKQISFEVVLSGIILQSLMYILAMLACKSLLWSMAL
jgi:hypothetical protein